MAVIRPVTWASIVPPMVSSSSTRCSYRKDKRAPWLKAAFVRTSEGTVWYSTY